MDKACKRLKGLDMFGHTINLNFNQEGDTHRTIYGGCISLFIRLAMAIYVFWNVSKMIHHLDDSNLTEVSSINLDEFGEI